MTETEFIKLCKYYKGEKECPFSLFDDYTRLQFWSFEKMYAESHLSEHEKWEGFIDTTIKDFPNLKPVFTDKSLPLVIKGMLCCSIALTLNMSPMGGVDFIADYGK